jgi:hypothetical protein
VTVSQEDLQDAVSELHLYLSDQKPPLIVADSVRLLLRCPPHYLAAQIHAWVAGQALTAPLADYLYHGAKKLSVMGDLDLLPKEALARRLHQLIDPLVQYAPEDERELLRTHLTRLGQAVQAAALGAPSVLHRQSGAQPAPAAAPPAPEQALSREVRRLALLLEHLRPLASSAAAPPERRRELASQFMAAAAVKASSAGEFDRELAPLRELGIETTMDHVFRTLAGSLAGWLLPRPEGGQSALLAREQLAAMRQIISLAGDPAEAAKRFREMVHAAIEQFNEGQLGRAVAMFELAQRLAVEEKVQRAYVDPLRTQGHEYLNADRLRKFAERPDCRAPLRLVLDFFTGLTADGLLDSLNGEPQRERRHHLLALLEAHEGVARAAAWRRLQASVAEGAQVDPFFQMNLVYLLRIIPRPSDASVEEEVGVVMQTSGRDSPPPLVKQIIAYFAATRHEAAERALATYLHVFESMLLEPETAAYSPDDLEVLLDRTCYALARYGTPRSWGLLIDHGLKSEARLGSPFLRLAEAGRLDLSASRDLVDRIVAAVRAELPRGGLLGIMASRNEEKATSLIQALGGTPLPEVKALLQEIAGKYPGRTIAQAAAKALAGFAQAAQQPSAAPAGLSGDLELFGLPNLLGTLAQSQLTGVLSLLDKRGGTRATLLFDKGRFCGGQAGAVMGEEIVYQLFEKPFPGTFAFVGRTDISSQPRAGAPVDVIGLLLEGARRYDEFKRAAAVVPDGSRLKPTGRAHGLLADEDEDLASMVWKEIGSGKTAEECEDAVPIDAYRVRRLAAHWVEEGALAVIQA